MNYREGDLVRIKSMTWWNKNKPKSFPEQMAKDCCGEAVEIKDIGDSVRIKSRTWWEEYKPHNFPEHIEDIDVDENLYPYFITSGWKNWWFREDWIEEISIINIHLKLMKSEI